MALAEGRESDADMESRDNSEKRSSVQAWVDVHGITGSTQSPPPAAETPIYA